MSLKTIADHLAAYAVGFYKGELLPWLKNLLTTIEHDVVTAILPIAHEELQALASGGALTFASIGAAAEATAARALAAGQQAAAHDVMAAITTALAERSITG